MKQKNKGWISILKEKCLVLRTERYQRQREHCNRMAIQNWDWQQKNQATTSNIEFTLDTARARQPEVHRVTIGLIINY